jgi:hypothetical protein
MLCYAQVAAAAGISVRPQHGAGVAPKHHFRSALETLFEVVHSHNPTEALGGDGQPLGASHIEALVDAAPRDADGRVRYQALLDSLLVVDSQAEIALAA